MSYSCLYSCDDLPKHALVRLFSEHHRVPGYPSSHVARPTRRHQVFRSVIAGFPVLLINRQLGSTCQRSSVYIHPRATSDIGEPFDRRTNEGPAPFQQLAAPMAGMRPPPDIGEESIAMQEQRLVLAAEGVIRRVDDLVRATWRQAFARAAVVSIPC